METLASYVVHLALLAGQDLGNIVTLRQEMLGQQWAWTRINLLSLLFALCFLEN